MPLNLLGEEQRAPTPVTLPKLKFAGIDTATEIREHAARIAEKAHHPAWARRVGGSVKPRVSRAGKQSVPPS
jgi:hypothetical protein